MLTPSQYDHLCDQLIDLYAQLDESIIEDMTRRMLRMGRVSESTRWQAQQLQESGLLYEDILSDIARRTNATSQHVRGLFEDAGVESIRNDNRYYQAAGLEGIVRMSDRALQMLNAGYIKCQGDLKNLTLTTAVTAQQAYIQACNLAYMQVTSGTMDYNTAIRKAVQKSASDGSYVLYPSGHRDRLDVAVRRSVLTGVGQTVRQLSLINASDMDCDVMELTAHAGARPSHAQWQGQLVSLSGRRGYLSTSDIGYGSVDGFGGVNCRHDWHPFFENFSNRAYSEERLKELNEAHIKIGDKLYTDYEVSQMQRALERKIREKKRQVVAAKTFVSEAKSDAEAKAAQEDFQKASVKLKKAEQNLKDFLNQTGFLPDNARTWVNGFGRSEAQKAVRANKKALTGGQKSGKIKSQGKYSDLGAIKERLRNDKRVFEEYYSAIKERFSHGSKNAKKAFTKYVPSDSVANASFEGTPHFDDKNTKRIYMHYLADLNNTRGAGATWFHEHGHLIDDAAGAVSNNDNFRNLLYSDYKAYLKSYAKSHNIEEMEKVYQLIGNDLPEMRNHSAVSDLINAISENKIKGVAWHPPEYWTRDSNLLCAEAFAHMFEAQFDDIRYEEMQKYFPNALKKFEQILGEIIK